MLCPSIFKGPNSTLVQVFSLPCFFFEKLHILSCRGKTKTCIILLRKIRKNMKGWDYSQLTNGDYHLKEST